MTALAPMLPPAPPPRFSITMLCLSVTLSRSETMRAMASVGPPAGNGTITLIGRDG